MTSPILTLILTEGDSRTAAPDAPVEYISLAASALARGAWIGFAGSGQPEAALLGVLAEADHAEVVIAAAPPLAAEGPVTALTTPRLAILDTGAAVLVRRDFAQSHGLRPNADFGGSAAPAFARRALLLADRILPADLTPHSAPREAAAADDAGLMGFTDFTLAVLDGCIALRAAYGAGRADDGFRALLVAKFCDTALVIWPAVLTMIAVSDEEDDTDLLLTFMDAMQELSLRLPALDHIPGVVHAFGPDGAARAEVLRLAAASHDTAALAKSLCG